MIRERRQAGRRRSDGVVGAEIGRSLPLRSGHGRVKERRLHAFEIEPLSADFPHARTLLVLRSQRTIKKTGAASSESRYYLSSVTPEEYQVNDIYASAVAAIKNPPLPLIWAAR